MLIEIILCNKITSKEQFQISPLSVISCDFLHSRKLTCRILSCALSSLHRWKNHLQKRLNFGSKSFVNVTMLDFKSNTGLDSQILLPTVEFFFFDHQPFLSSKHFVCCKSFCPFKRWINFWCLLQNDPSEMVRKPYSKTMAVKSAIYVSNFL